MVRAANCKKSIAVSLVCLIFAGGCVSTHKAPKAEAPNPQKAGVRYASDEVAIGEKIHQAIMQSFYPYTEPGVVEYVNRIGRSLAEYAERKDLPYRFTLLYNDKIYAASAPGGFVYLTTGLVYFLDNESELAAVMAHEIGELQYKDPRLSKAKKVLEAVLEGGQMVGPVFGEIGALAILGLTMVKAVTDARQLSADERIEMADERALRYMAEAGYDPQSMIDVMHKFKNGGDEVEPYFYDYYQSRPITVERINHLNLEFEKLPLAGESFTTNRDIFLKETRGLREIYKQ